MSTCRLTRAVLERAAQLIDTAGAIGAIVTAHHPALAVGELVEVLIAIDHADTLLADVLDRLQDAEDLGDDRDPAGPAPEAPGGDFGAANGTPAALPPGALRLAAESVRTRRPPEDRP